jgi:uncharacterized damage-inducible protein DinB
MSDVEDLRARMAAARNALLVALDGVTQDQLVRRPPGEVTEEEQRWTMRDVLWHVGTVEDWIRRMSSQALGGRPIDAYAPPRRPAVTNTLPLLLEWLDQTRGATMAFMRDLEDEDLAIEFVTPAGEDRTIGRVLNHLAVHDGQHREHVLALLELPEVER